MITYETEKYIILCPKFKIFSQKAVDEIQDLIQNAPMDKELAIDMSSLYTISQEFLDLIHLNPKRLVLFNCCAEVLVLFNLTNSDRNVKLFTGKIDMEEDKRELMNRKFTLL